jgi:hypothetical protein
MQRIREVPEAEELVIEVNDISWTTTPSKRRDLKERFTEEKLKSFLEMLARRLKYDLLLWRVYGKNEEGAVPSETFRAMGLRYMTDLPFKVVQIKPEPEAQITPRTKIVATLSPDS